LNVTTNSYENPKEYVKKLTPKGKDLVKMPKNSEFVENIK
jgi:hypothetical protein